MRGVLAKIKQVLRDCPTDRARLATLILIATGMKGEALRLLEREEAVYEIKAQGWPPPIEALFLGWLHRLAPPEGYLLQGRNSQGGSKPVSRMTLWRILTRVGNRKVGAVIRKFRTFYRILKQICVQLIERAEDALDYELVPLPQGDPQPPPRRKKNRPGGRSPYRFSPVGL